MRWPWAKPELEIMPLTGADARAVADLHKASFARAWTDGEFLDLLARPSTTGFKITRAGGRAITGFVLLALAADEAEILTVAVAPSERRQGIGERLMRKALQFASGDRVSSVFLEVEDTNTAAVSLYRKIGFKQVGRREGYYRGVSAAGGTALVMRIDLD